MTTTTTDLATLTKQATELRGAMMEALGKAEDNTVRRLGNELAQVNRQILEAESEVQGDARTEYMGYAHDALNAFEVDGQTLTVRFAVNDEGQESLAIVFEPTEGTIESIKAAIASIERPSTAVRWTYGRDEEGHQSFDFGRAARKTPTTQPDVTRSTGWKSPTGHDISLGDAFNACATPAEKAERDGKATGSQKYAVQIRVVKANSYTKS